MITRRLFVGSSLGAAALSGFASPRAWAQGDEVVFLTEEGTPSFREFWEAVTKEFLDETGIAVRVEYLPIDTGLAQRLSMMLQAGTPPDLTQGYMGNGAYSMALRGILEPMDDVVSYLESEVGDTLSDTYRIRLEGSDYLAPLWCSAGNMWVRRDLLDAAGISGMPEKWDAYIDAVDKLNAAATAGSTVGGGKSWCTTSDFLNIVWGNGTRVTGRDDGGKVIITLDDDENIEKAAEALNFWKKVSDVSVPAQDFGCGNLIEAMWSGNAATVPYVGARPKVEATRKGQPFAKDIWPMQFPWNAERVSMASFEGLMCFRNSPRKDAAKEFAKFLFTGDRYYRMLQRDPLHNLSPFPSVATSEKMLDDPFIQEQLGPEVFAAVADIASRSRTFAGEVSPVNTFVEPLYGSFEMATAVYNVVYGGNDAKDEMKSLGTTLRRLLERQQG
ncbi:ABC transporter substrate-binding protein [Acuticoccus kandeliae]|uniref:ABC transporter substrate-binding protein n=1 Tax=Acuticoccus kandeliae TaxID=2073160 RepID=UPI000D3E4263|nr:ABC transporter substrate-binding protein [Acuticoccus kandeliae]